ncbi:DUF6502 family protein [uncultured Aquitalea sp.]|uniref:DUF6502 family protein n=1 Tax=uncultured Aquitalea sp. TaxID=540272 RepID=UPI0025F8125C|nr:DUF6502 family protein [uncultured Aquitalea sp.]
MSTPATPSPKLIRALRHLLAPLIRLLLSQGFGYPAFAELMKRVYVDVADKHFQLNGKQTDSRISLLSGVHRKDVKRLREAAEAPLDLTRDSHSSQSAQLLSVWMGDERFTDSQGQPLPLARLASQGGEKSFEFMAHDFNKDMRPRVFLDEWQRVGIVKVDEQDMVHLDMSALATAPDLEQKLDFFGRNIHDHMAGAVSNIEGRTPPHLDRCVFYHGLTLEQTQELKALSEKLAMQALLDVNRRARAMMESNQGKTFSPWRMHFGSYFYHAEDEYESGHE